MKRITWLLAAAVLVAGPALAATPKDTVVMAKAIDDIISLDPAESFEFSGSEAVGNVYERLIAYDLKDVSKLKGELAESWSVGRRRQDLHVQDEEGHQVPLRQSGDGARRGLLAPARRRPQQVAGVHPDPVRLHQGEREGEDPGDRRPDAGDRDRPRRWRRPSSTTA